ncbi:MAG: molybdopterin molybdotransferase MoeA [Caulobacter sp.]|nr:molybdopterin molybdotransferase MoeA [Caulobacter sp.]
MITFDEATELVARVAAPLSTESVALGEARGRVLAAPVLAARASPSCCVSAMDGYAVCEADLAILPVELAVVGESFAGEAFAGDLPRQACVRVFTGARLPAGADRVIMQEDVRREGEIAHFGQPLPVRRHLRLAGSDFGVGDRLVPAGRRLNAQRLVAAAAANLGDLTVYRRPKVAIIATGDELTTPGRSDPGPDAIPESVSFGVAALAEHWGGEIVSRRRCGDDLALLETAAAKAAGEADVVVVTGGASVGERDFARQMFVPLGLELVFDKVAMKPGKPVWLGRVGGTLVVGLPGNPTSALVTARLFLAPLLLGLGGGDPREALAWRPMALAASLGREGDRDTFHRGRATPGGVTLAADQDSSAQRALAESDLLVRRRPGEPHAAAGDCVAVLDL